MPTPAEAILIELTRILQENTSLRQPVTPELALLSARALDSMDFMNYVTVVEEQFNVTISDAEIAEHRLGVVGNMVKFLQEKKPAWTGRA
jgi:acyl carrier protein